MQRRYGRLPEPTRLSPELNRLAAEADQLAERLSVAEQEQHRLADDAAIRQAEQADADAATQAVRQGGTAAAVGTPARDELVKKQEAIIAEVDALGRAVVGVEDEMTRAFVQMRNAAKTNGEARLAASTVKYQRAIDAVLSARREFIEAQAFVEYIVAASRAHSNVRRPVAWNEDAYNPAVQMPSAPGRPEPGPQLTFRDALMMVTGELNSSEKEMT